MADMSGYQLRLRKITFRPGDVITESRDVTHWAENKTSSKVVLVGIDFFKPSRAGG